MSGAVVTLRSTSGSEAIAAASGSASRAVAELELTLGEGPSRDAFNQGRPVLVDDLNGASRAAWVGYTSAAIERGIHSVFAFPLHLGAARFGVLTLIAGSPQHLGATRTARCLGLTELTTQMLLASSDAQTDGRLDPDLENALDFRSEIYQAQGMVMVTLGTDLADALARMRAQAFHTEQTLFEVAVEILAGRLALIDETAG
jgi:GAF domain-containing protein